MFAVRCWKYESTDADGQPDGGQRRSFLGFLGTHTRLHEQDSVVSFYPTVWDGESDLKKFYENSRPTFSCASTQWVEVAKRVGAGAGAGRGARVREDGRDWDDSGNMSRLFGSTTDRQLDPSDDSWWGAIGLWVAHLKQNLCVEREVDSGAWRLTAAVTAEDRRVHELQVV
jgi:hypothetical protein